MAQIERNRFGHYVGTCYNCGGGDWSTLTPDLLDCRNLSEIAE